MIQFQIIYGITETKPIPLNCPFGQYPTTTVLTDRAFN